MNAKGRDGDEILARFQDEDEELRPPRQAALVRSKGPFPEVEGLEIGIAHGKPVPALAQGAKILDGLYDARVHGVPVKFLSLTRQ